ncbi:T6SS immunity protein Tdi1 domain-containing protein [Psychroserpens mesophilus]|uniref:T6SS immunity protein Tdi1 domain-containing protein n=1 Tax=Psychroserpens mesophilus TaxID=325473 RepID=UPI00058E08C5|nr:T6SS immunity protein Tdi1 domain-containing protein [Psychroserpens mesophilus]
MNLEPFKIKYKNQKKLIDQKSVCLTTPNSEINELFEQFGGFSFENGILRIHNYETSKKWTDIICESFPKYTNRIIVYGFDWVGRQFAKDINKDFTYLFDIATGEDFMLEQPLSEFFNVDLIEFADETLDISGFKNWNSKNVELKFNEVVAYKIPLWLGGKDDSSNYEITDSEVNWEINRQLMNK